MISRRSFIKNSILSASGLLLPGCLKAIDRNKSIRFPTSTTSATLLGWWDVANSANTITSGAMHVLVDKSGNGRHMNSSSAFPLYTSSGGPNNAPYITIDTTHGLAATGLSLGQPFVTIYLVMKQTDLSGSGRTKIIDLHGDGSNGLFNYDSPDSSLGSRLGSVFSGATSYTTDKNFTRTDRWSIVTGSINSTNSFFRINREHNSLCYTGLSAPNNAITQISLGDWQFLSSSAKFQVTEIIVYSGTISKADDIANLEYLEAKYQTPNNPYIETYGDSITYGQGGGVSIYQAWVSLVAVAKGLNYSNFGVSGTTINAGSGSAGVPGSNFVDLYQTCFDNANWNQYVTFGYGHNDWAQSLISSSWKTTYQSYIQSFLDHGYNPARMLMIAPYIAAANQASYAQTVTYISQIASALGLLFYNAVTDFNANGGDTLLRDGIHPNAAGMTLMSNSIQALLP